MLVKNRPQAHSPLGRPAAEASMAFLERVQLCNSTHVYVCACTCVIHVKNTHHLQYSVGPSKHGKKSSLLGSPT